MIPLAVVLLVVGVGLVYWFPLRRRFRRWGATGEELARAMPGDALVADATYSTTLAVTVDAAPRDIWPWLLQLGYRRGGLYSYDWLDRLFGYLDAPSANRVLPEFQQLAVGDVIPLGRGGGFPVAVLDPPRTLVLGGTAGEVAWAWEFGLYPLADARTRLVSRNRVRAPATCVSWCFMRVIEPAAFLMTRRMLLGLRARAERLAAARGAERVQAA